MAFYGHEREPKRWSLKPITQQQKRSTRSHIKTHPRNNTDNKYNSTNRKHLKCKRAYQPRNHVNDRPANFNRNTSPFRTIKHEPSSEMQTQTNTELNTEKRVHKHVEDDLNSTSEYFDADVDINLIKYSRLCIESIGNEATNIYVYGNRIIHSQSTHVYQWEFKIQQKNLTEKHQGPMFGILDNDGSLDMTDYCFYGYGFQFAKNRKEQQGFKCIKYKNTCVNGLVYPQHTPFLDSRIKNGSTITMRLDLVRRTLSFVNNADETGDVCIDHIITHPRRYYRLVCRLGANHQCVTLMKYHDNEPIEHKSLAEQTRINHLLAQHVVLKQELVASKLCQQRASAEIQQKSHQLLNMQQQLLNMQQQLHDYVHQSNVAGKTQIELGVWERRAKTYAKELEKANNKLQMLSEKYEQLMVDKGKEDECAVCLSNERSHICVPCGHLCICQKCVSVINGNCPMCQKTYDRVVQVYK
eukprot:26869_1